MNSTISRPVLSASNSMIDFASCSHSDDSFNDRPRTVVLQPMDWLDQASIDKFQHSFNTALEQASEGVLIDLLWIASTDAYGINALLMAVERAAALNKSLSFQSMNRRIKAAMEAELQQRRSQRLGSWKTSFAADLEHFLDSKAYGITGH
jgi:anti-anti-sigma regulatory factor